MLSAEKLKKLCEDSKITVEHLAEHLVSGGRDKQEAISAVRNWKKGLIIPIPRKNDVENLILIWHSPEIIEKIFTDWVHFFWFLCCFGSSQSV